MRKKLDTLLFFVIFAVLSTTTIWGDSSLGLNSTGDTVKSLQEVLINKGYLSGNADGIYGPKTQSAVKEYQEANGLNSSGIADETTLELLLSENHDETPAAMEGYTELQTVFMNIQGEMTDSDIKELARKYKLRVYDTKAENEGVYYTVYISANSFTEYHKYSFEYEFGDHDYIEVIFDRWDDYPKLNKVRYNFGQYVNGYYYNVEYSVKGNLKGNHYFVGHAYISIDPTAHYASAKDALDTALSLYN